MQLLHHTMGLFPPSLPLIRATLLAWLLVPTSVLLSTCSHSLMALRLLGMPACFAQTWGSGATGVMLLPLVPPAPLPSYTYVSTV